MPQQDGKQLKDLSIHLDKLGQSGATLGQVSTWDGVNWSPGDAADVAEVLTVPGTVNINDLVYSTGDYTADKADNGSTTTTPAIGIVVAKPTGTTAKVKFYGVFTGFSGMTPGAEQFLGAAGALVEPGSLPSTPGSIIQRIGVALSAAVLIFAPGEPVLL